jgi:hypothetical protein
MGHTYMFEWYMAKACSENGHKNDMCAGASSHVVNVNISKSHIYHQLKGESCPNRFPHDSIVTNLEVLLSSKVLRLVKYVIFSQGWVSALLLQESTYQYLTIFGQNVS